MFGKRDSEVWRHSSWCLPPKEGRQLNRARSKSNSGFYESRRHRWEDFRVDRKWKSRRCQRGVALLASSLSLHCGVLTTARRRRVVLGLTSIGSNACFRIHEIGESFGVNPPALCKAHPPVSSRSIVVLNSNCGFRISLLRDFFETSLRDCLDSISVYVRMTGSLSFLWFCIVLIITMAYVRLVRPKLCEMSHRLHRSTDRADFHRAIALYVFWNGSLARRRHNR